ncbi:MAG: TolC family outer membrane protein [Desulfovibrionaceae bacterium]|nr:TolC family outer membrane protein [Desulfovibrionaceae bacterium]
MAEKIIFFKPYRNLMLVVAMSCLVFSSQAAAGEQITVKQSVEYMLGENHSLKSVQENRAAVEHEVDRAKAGWGPRVDLTARGGYGKLTNDTTRSGNYNHGTQHSSASLLLTQPIWDGGLTAARVREAEETWQSLDCRVLDNANSLALDAVIAHIDVLRRIKISELAKANVERHEDILEKAKDRERLGVDTMADVTQAQSRLSRARSQYIEAKASQRIGEKKYFRLTRHTANSLQEVEMPEHLFANAEELIREAQRNNPKVQAYIRDVKAAKAVKDQARAAYMPSFSIEAGPSYSERANRSDAWTAEFDVSGVVRWNIFNSGADVAENKAASARIRQSRRVLYDYFDEVKNLSEQAWTEYNSAREQYDSYMEAIDYNTVTRDAYEEQFVLGQRSLLDVLDAESELFNSATQAATAYSNALIAAYKMHALGGKLLDEVGIDRKVLKDLPHDSESLDSLTLPAS